MSVFSSEVVHLGHVLQSDLKVDEDIVPLMKANHVLHTLSCAEPSKPIVYHFMVAHCGIRHY